MGVAARQQLLTNPKNTAVWFKNFIGRKLKDHYVQMAATSIPFELVEMQQDQSLGTKVIK